MSRLERPAQVVVAALAPRAKVWALAGGSVTAGASLAPWARFSGFPGKMALGGFPGGARLFCLVLCAGAAFALLDVPGRRRAGVAATLGAGAVAALNVVAIANQGSGPADVAWGAWLAVAGSLLAAAGMAGLPADRVPPPADRAAPAPVARPAWVDAGGLLLAAAAVTVAVVWGLAIEEPSRFLSYLVFAGFVSVAARRLGAVDWLSEASHRHPRLAVAAAVAAAVVFPFTQQGDAYWLRVFASIGVFATAAIGLNIVVGLAGLLDLGYVAFFGVGAYVGAMLAGAAFSTVGVHLPFVLVVLLGGVVAALFGVVIGAPTLRLRGDYLAIVTLGFGEIFRITANNWDSLTRGPNGISGIPDLELGSFNFGESHEVLGFVLPGFANYYFLELLLIGAAVVVFTRLNDSRVGRAWIAIREDEVAAAASGVNTTRLKLLAFAIGAFLAGSAGTVNAHVTTQVSPDSYTFLESILLVAAVVLGGMGTVAGALLGSTVLFVVPEKLREFQDMRLLLFGAALVVMMRFRPEGLLPSGRRRRELHERDHPAAK